MTFRASFMRQNAIIRRLFRPNGQKNALQSVCNAVKADALWKLLKRSTGESPSPLCRVWCDFASTLHYSTLYINKRVAKKLYKLYTNPTFNPTSRWFSVSCEMYSLRRKLYTNYTLNSTLRRFKPYTASVRETIHEAEHKPYILFLNTNLANGI